MGLNMTADGRTASKGEQLLLNSSAGRRTVRVRIHSTSARSRSLNFWTFPVDVFGSDPNTTVRRALSSMVPHETALHPYRESSRGSARMTETQCPPEGEAELRTVAMSPKVCSPTLLWTNAARSARSRGDGVSARHQGKRESDGQEESDLLAGGSPRRTEQRPRRQ